MDDVTRTVVVSSVPVWRPVTREELAAIVAECDTPSVLPDPRPPAAVRQAKRVAKDRARRKAAKKHKQNMRRTGG